MGILELGPNPGTEMFKDHSFDYLARRKRLGKKTPEKQPLKLTDGLRKGNERDGYEREREEEKVDGGIFDLSTLIGSRLMSHAQTKVTVIAAVPCDFPPTV